MLFISIIFVCTNSTILKKIHCILSTWYFGIHNRASVISVKITNSYNEINRQIILKNHSFQFHEKHLEKSFTIKHSKLLLSFSAVNAEEQISNRSDDVVVH